MISLGSPRIWPDVTKTYATASAWAGNGEAFVNLALKRDWLQSIKAYQKLSKAVKDQSITRIPTAIFEFRDRLVILRPTTVRAAIHDCLAGSQK